MIEGYALGDLYIAVDCFCTAKGKVVIWKYSGYFD